MVTFPGADGLFSYEQNSTEIALIRRAVSVSIERHGSQIVALVGHHDCAGNPGDVGHHNKHIRKALQEMSSWNLNTQAIGLYVNEKKGD
jgi:hypothetical protein